MRELSSNPIIRMRRALDEPFPAPTWPVDVYPSTFTPEQAREVHNLFAIGYANGGGTVGQFNDWWAGLVADSEYEPTLCFVARTARDQIVGAAQCWTSAFVKDLVVHPLWRRRGIGEALMLHAFAVFRNRGAAYLDLKVLKENPFDALQLYCRLGMKEVTE